MHRIAAPAVAIAVLPLLLSACGSANTDLKTTTAAPSLQASVDAAYRTAGVSPTSFHLNETVNITVNNKGYGGDTISGNIYSDPSNTSASYASLTDNFSVLGKNEGNMVLLLKNKELYINDAGVHASGLKATPGWKVMSLADYATAITNVSSSPVVPTIAKSAQSSLLGAILKSGTITANGSSTIGGQAVNVYTATIPYAKLAQAMSTSKGEFASTMVKLMSLYHMTGTVKVTVATTTSTDRIADVSGVFSSTFAPVKGSPTKYHFVLSVQQQYTNYGVKFTVAPPASAKTITSFGALYSLG